MRISILLEGDSEVPDYLVDYITKYPETEMHNEYCPQDLEELADNLITNPTLRGWCNDFVKKGIYLLEDKGYTTRTLFTRRIRHSSVLFAKDRKLVLLDYNRNLKGDNLSFFRADSGKIHFLKVEREKGYELSKVFDSPDIYYHSFKSLFTLEPSKVKRGSGVSELEVFDL